MKAAGKSSGGAVREAVSTVAPAAAKRRAVASPSPRLPPVTSTRRSLSPSSTIGMCGSFSKVNSTPEPYS